MKIKISKKVHFSTHIILVPRIDPIPYPDFKGDSGEISVRYEENTTKILCGIGDNATVDSKTIRTASAKAIQKAIDLKRTEVTFTLPNHSYPISLEKHIIEGIILGSYKFDKYKSEKYHRIETVEIIGELSRAEVHRTETICKSTNFTRDLVNENASVITPEAFATEALKLQNSNHCTVTVLNKKDIQKKGLNLIYSVGKGSQTPPCLIFIEYNGNKRSGKKTAIVGKGITFDSGGQNLKPTGSIETMRTDMAGAAAVLGTMKALIELNSPVNVVGVIVAAHNAIGSDAFFPGDIYKSYSGKTIEIHSTDAEGRLILADAVSYCQKQYKPDELIDLATLTGGILSALGDIVAGLFSNNDFLAEKLFEAGEKSSERLWRFPLYKEYSDALKGELGDLRNLSKLKKGYASSIIGAAFIQEFIEDIPWAHLDIAGTSFNEGATRGEIPQFATGFGVRLLMEYLANDKTIY
ncbi:MAG: leucyl aminopeptidase family protein [Fibrobacter sp.]|nr:leucyl aminopeptidase family protein [Fibrobacter sp.]